MCFSWSPMPRGPELDIEHSSCVFVCVETQGGCNRTPRSRNPTHPRGKSDLSVSVRCVDQYSSSHTGAGSILAAQQLGITGSSNFFFYTALVWCCPFFCSSQKSITARRPFCIQVYTMGGYIVLLYKYVCTLLLLCVFLVLNTSTTLLVVYMYM